jgi:uncharacterized protein
MKILIDIGHPSHVHYFKNAIRSLKSNHHQIIITSRDKEIAQNLLSAYGFEYISRGSGKAGIWGKMRYLIKTDLSLLKIAKALKPDLFLSCSSPYIAHVAFILRKPHICIDDTDISNYEHIMYAPFSDSIISPIGFKKNFGKKHFFIDSTFDLFYLHPKQFSPNPSVKNELGIDSRKKTVFLRFTSMSASHDWRYGKTNYEDKIHLVNTLKDKYNILLSSEDKLPDELMKFKVRLSPEKIHDALYYSNLFVGESGSMSTEAAILGVPSINLTASAGEVGVFKRLVETELMYIIPNAKEALIKALDILNDDNFNFQEYRKQSQHFIADKVDLTSFLVWFIENYPLSKIEMQKNPEIQNQFKTK